MKKGTKVGLGILAALIVVILGLIVWQWENINAIYMGIVSSEEKIEEKIQENKEKLAKQLEEDGVINSKAAAGLSKEDEEKIAKGELTVDEAVEKLFEPEPEPQQELNNNEDAAKDETTVSGNANIQEEKQPETKPQEQPVDEAKLKEKQLIETAVKKMYTLKATFTQELATIESEAKKEYIKGGMTKEEKLKIADVYVPKIVEAEKRCNVEVDVVLGELEKGLKEINGNVGVVKLIREQYDNEKQLQKSKYISKYL